LTDTKRKSQQNKIYQAFLAPQQKKTFNASILIRRTQYKINPCRLSRRDLSVPIQVLEIFHVGEINYFVRQDALMTERNMATDISEKFDECSQELASKAISKGPTSILRKKINKTDLSSDIKTNRCEESPTYKGDVTHSSKNKCDSVQNGSAKRTSSLSPKKRRGGAVGKDESNRMDSPDNKDIERSKRIESMKYTTSSSPRKEGRVTVIRSASDGHALMNQMRDAMQFVVDDLNDATTTARPSDVKKHMKRTEQPSDVGPNPRIRRSRSHCTLENGKVVGIDVKEKSNRLKRSTTISAKNNESTTKKFSEDRRNSNDESEGHDAGDIHTMPNGLPNQQNTRQIQDPSTPGRQRVRTKIALKDLVKEDMASIDYDDAMKTPQKPGAIARFLQARSETTPKNSSSSVVSGMTNKVIKALPIVATPGTPKTSRRKSKSKKDTDTALVDSLDNGFSESAIDDEQETSPSRRSQRTKHTLRESLKGRVQEEKHDTKPCKESRRHHHGDAVTTGHASSPRQHISDDDFLTLFNRPRNHDADSKFQNTTNRSEDVSPRRRRSSAEEIKAKIECTPSRKVGTNTPSAQRNAMKQLQINVEHVVPMLMIGSTTPHKKSATSTGKKKVDSIAWSTGYSPAI
jgi:hypothetical protein